MVLHQWSLMVILYKSLYQAGAVVAEPQEPAEPQGQEVAREPAEHRVQGVALVQVVPLDKAGLAEHREPLAKMVLTEQVDKTEQAEPLDRTGLVEHQEPLAKAAPVVPQGYQEAAEPQAKMELMEHQVKMELMEHLVKMEPAEPLDRTEQAEPQDQPEPQEPRD